MRLHHLLGRAAVVVALLSIAACASHAAPSSRPSAAARFDAAEIRAAERALLTALEADDPTAWVYHYTEDAVLIEPSGTVAGRPALLEMARAMTPLSSVVLTPQRTEGHGDLAYVHGTASWVSGRGPEAGATTSVRLVIVWRKEPDGRWRVALEVFSPAVAER